MVWRPPPSHRVVTEAQTVSAIHADHREGWAAGEGAFIRYGLDRGIPWFWVDPCINRRDDLLPALNQEGPSH